MIPTTMILKYEKNKECYDSFEATLYTILYKKGIIDEKLGKNNIKKEDDIKGVVFRVGFNKSVRFCFNYYNHKHQQIVQTSNQRVEQKHIDMAYRLMKINRLID